MMIDTFVPVADRREERIEVVMMQPKFEERELIMSAPNSNDEEEVLIDMPLIEEDSD